MISYIRGYYIITVEGIGTERFLNHIRRNKVSIYNVVRISSTKIQFYLDRKDIKLFKEIYRGSNFDIKVKQKTGLPFIMSRVYKYKGMWICAILSLLLLIATSQFVTDIYIQSPEGIKEEALRKELYQVGLKPGIYKKSIDRKEIRDYMMSKFDKIAYLSINVKGTNIFVTITKKSETLESIEKSDYCNIIAKKDAIIERVIPRSGNQVADENQIVKKGDVLITGANTKSIPEIWANTFYEVKKSASYIDIEKEKTGQTKRVYTLKLYNQKFIIRRNIKYKDYTIDNKEYKLTVGNYTFPLSITESIFYETKDTKVQKDKDILKKQLAQDALREMEYIIPASAKYIDVKHSYNINKNILEYVLTVTASENIAKVYPLTKAQAQELIDEQNNKEGEELIPSNPEKRPINDIRNNFEENNTEEDKDVN